MKRRSRIFGFAALLVIGSLLAAASASASAPRPTLTIVKSNPLTLRGMHFKSGEHVRVTRVLVGVKVVRTVTAGTGGTFTVSYGPSAVFDRCDGTLYVVAIGDKGSRATAKWLPQPVCLDLGSRG